MRDEELHELLRRIDVTVARLDERVTVALRRLDAHEQQLDSLQRWRHWLDGVRAAGSAIVGAFAGIATSHGRLLP